MPEKETVMEFEVDLQCPRCDKKVKKILCKIPQIRDQRYDKKANTVTITVVSCNPEKIRDKLYCKGGGVIKCIKIKPPPPNPSPPPKPIEPTPPPSPPPRPCCCGCRGCDCGCGHGWCGCGCGCGCGHGRPCHVIECYYEENLPACAIM